VTAGQDGDAAAIAGILAGAVADLDGYIGRRAAELAAPMIRAALADADARSRAAAMAVQRRDDVVAELRRRVKVVDRLVDQAEQWRQATGCQTPAEYQRRAAAAAAGEPSEDDRLLADAARLVITRQAAGPGLIQRGLRVGFARAGLLLGDLVASGVVAEPVPGPDGPVWKVLVPASRADEKLCLRPASRQQPGAPAGS
jgi:hypothetical protein